MQNWLQLMDMLLINGKSQDAMRSCEREIQMTFDSKA